MSYRKSDGPFIDELKKTISSLEKELATTKAKLEKRNVRRQRWRGVKYHFAKKWPWLLVMVAVGGMGTFFISCAVWCENEKAETKMENQKVRNLVFAAANRWIKDHNSGQGDAWCVVPEMGPMEKLDKKLLYSCEVLTDETGQMARLKCSPHLNKCYKDTGAK